MGVCKLIHFLNPTGAPKVLRQLVTPACSTTSLPPTLALPFLFLPDEREGNEVMPFLTFYFVMTSQPPVLLGSKGRGEHRAGINEQTVGTALRATGMRDLPWA